MICSCEAERCTITTISVQVKFRFHLSLDSPAILDTSNPRMLSEVRSWMTYVHPIWFATGENPDMCRLKSLSEFAYCPVTAKGLPHGLVHHPYIQLDGQIPQDFTKNKHWTNSHAHFFCWLRTHIFRNDMKMMLGSLTVRSSCSMFQVFQSQNMMSTAWITQKLSNFHWWSQGYRPKSVK